MMRTLVATLSLTLLPALTLADGPASRPSKRHALQVYTAFGGTYPFGSISGTFQRYTFTGRESSGHSAAGAPMYYRYRQYSPSLGRFGRRDPVVGGDSQFHPYVSVGNDPVSSVDVDGTSTREEEAKWRAAEKLRRRLMQQMETARRIAHENAYREAQTVAARAILKEQERQRRQEQNRQEAFVRKINEENRRGASGATTRKIELCCGTVSYDPLEKDCCWEEPKTKGVAGVGGKVYDFKTQCCDRGKVVEKVKLFAVNRSGGQRTGPMGGHMDLVLPDVGLIGFFGYGREGGSGVRSSNRIGMRMHGIVNSTLAEWVSLEKTEQPRPPYAVYPEYSYIPAGNGQLAVSPPQVSTIAELEICPEQAREMIAEFRQLNAHPGNFNMAGRNCSTIAAQIMGAGGILPRGILGVDNPQHVIDTLEAHYGANVYPGITEVDIVGATRQTVRVSTPKGVLNVFTGWANVSSNPVREVIVWKSLGPLPPFRTYTQILPGLGE